MLNKSSLKFIIAIIIIQKYIVHGFQCFHTKQFN